MPITSRRASTRRPSTSSTRSTWTSAAPARRRSSTGALEGLGTDRFGTRARCELTLTSGRWRLFTVSDDGLRVRLDDALVIDDWTWHAPKEQSFDFEVDAERAVSIEVEHFELDGWARLTVELRPLGD